MRAFEEAGVSIPGDIGIVGFDDIPLASFTHPPLTTVAQDHAQAGAALVEALIANIRGGSRGSTCCRPGWSFVSRRADKPRPSGARYSYAIGL
jgi:DNA-binding LacI/PurR family transcriptional regulator